jgi:hypothetical protein
MTIHIVMPSDNEPDQRLGDGIYYQTKKGGEAYIDPRMAIEHDDYTAMRAAYDSCARYESDEVQRRIRAMMKDASAAYIEMVERELELWRNPPEKPKREEPESKDIPIPQDVAEKVAALLAKVGR